MTGQDSPNPYQSPDQVSNSAPMVPDESINYPGGFRTIPIAAAIGGLVIAAFPWIGIGGFYLGLLVYFGSFVALAFLLPYTPSELPLRLVGAVVFSLLMLVLYVPTCGFTMALFAANDQVEIGWTIASVVAFVTTISLGALRIRAVVRRKHPIPALERETADWQESNPFSQQSAEDQVDE
ncbi:MAG: hypothetical protein AAGJ83_03005 [Planctomycetota bacterium]